jgi:hypothetical protein
LSRRRNQNQAHSPGEETENRKNIDLIHPRTNPNNNNNHQKIGI